MKKQCAVCGASFDAPPTTKKVTCGSAECVTIRKRQTHTGKHPVWSEAARQRKSQEGKTPNLQLGTPAALKSPLAGPFETNQESKSWWIVSPDDKQYAIRNLRKFCRDHPEFFSPDPWENAYAGLRQVQASLVGKTKRSVSQWKGWRLSCAAEK